MAIEFYANAINLPEPAHSEVQGLQDFMKATKAPFCLHELPRKEFASRIEPLKQRELFLQKYSAFKNLSNIHVVIFSSDDESPIRGESLSANTIVLFQNGDAKNAEDVFAHELYHTIRKRFNKPPRTLGEHLIEEGLANIFTSCHSRPEPNPQFLKINVEHYLTRFAHQIDKAKEMIDSTNFDHYGFFFGNATYPQDFGYTLGIIIVNTWLTAQNKTPITALKTPAKTIIQTWTHTPTAFLKKFPRSSPQP